MRFPKILETGCYLFVTLFCCFWLLCGGSVWLCRVGGAVVKYRVLRYVGSVRAYPKMVDGLLWAGKEGIL